MMAYVGIDVAKATLEVALWVEGKGLHTGQFSNDAPGFKQVQRWLTKHAKQASIHACLEATGRYSDDVAQFLYQTGYAVSVVNPARIKGYAEAHLRRNKTDKLDAALIADFVRTQNPALWTPPAPQWRHLQALVRHLEALEQLRQQTNNRLKAGSVTPAVQQHLQEHLAFLDAQIAHTKQLIHDHIDQHPDMKRERDLLDSIIGIGSLTAAKLLAEFRSISAFDNPRQLVAFAGLNPRQHVSGSSIRGHPAISKQGRASIRAALYMPRCVCQKP
jgi:transposase